MNQKLFSMMFSISYRLQQPMISPSCGHKFLGAFPSTTSSTLLGSRSYATQPPQAPSSSSGVQPDPKLGLEKEMEDEKRRLAAQLIAKGIKSMQEEDKLRLKESKLAKFDWKSLEKSLSMWQMRIGDILQQVQDMIPQSVKNKVKGR